MTNTTHLGLYRPNRADDIEIDTSLDDNFVAIDDKLGTLAKERVSVLKFGAKAGVDSTQAFNDAINSLPNGGEVIVPPGTYLINAWATGSVSDYPLGGVKLKSNITLRFLKGAKLQAITSDKDNYAILNLTGVSNVDIIGGELIGERSTHIGSTGQWGYGVAVVGSTNVRLQGVVAKNCWGDGFYVGHNQAADTESKDVTLEHCVADNNRRQGLSVTGAINTTVIGGRYMNTNGHLPESGIDLEPNPGRVVKDTKILGPKLDGNYGHGLQIGNASKGTIVDGVVATKNKSNGIYIGWSNDNILNNIQSYENDVNGIALETAHNNTLNVHTYKNGFHGVMIGNSNNNKLSGSSYANSQAANATHSNVLLFGSDFNNIQGMTCRAGTLANKPLYGININTADCDKNLVVNNDLYEGGTSLGLRDVGNFTETTAGNRKKDGTWGQFAG